MICPTDNAYQTHNIDEQSATGLFLQPICLFATIALPSADTIDIQFNYDHKNLNLGL